MLNHFKKFILITILSVVSSSLFAVPARIDISNFAGDWAEKNPAAYQKLILTCDGVSMATGTFGATSFVADDILGKTNHVKQCELTAIQNGNIISLAKFSASYNEASETLTHSPFIYNEKQICTPTARCSRSTSSVNGIDLQASYNYGVFGDYVSQSCVCNWQ